MTNLTNEARNKILARLIEHRFGAEEEALRKARRAFAARVYDDIFTKKQRDLMASLPSGWMPTKQTINVYFAGEITQLSLPDQRPVPHDKVHGTLAVYDARHPLAEAKVDLDRKAYDLTERRDAARANANAFLRNSKTLKQLVDAWPEIEPFANDVIEKPVKLPTIDLSKLNADLGLPLKKRKIAA